MLLNGFILINKEKGLTSFKTTQAVKTTLKVKKAGHTGTLDPIATGLLIICLEKATKKVPAFMEMEKEYCGEMILGLETDTLDMDGEIKKEVSPVNVTLSVLRKVCENYTGVIKQVPPHFSAVHHKGKRLYKWAREGKKIDLPPRTVEIKYFDIVSLNEKDGRMVFAFRVGCGKGMYVRALARDIGSDLNTGAVISKLERTKIGQYHIKDAVTITELKERYKTNTFLELIKT